MKIEKILISLTLMASFGSVGCGYGPIHASPISGEKNAWVEEASNAGLLYCVSGEDNSKIDPVCYPARRGTLAVPHHTMATDFSKPSEAKQIEAKHIEPKAAEEIKK